MKSKTPLMDELTALLDKLADKKIHITKKDIKKAIDKVVKGK